MEERTSPDPTSFLPDDPLTSFLYAAQQALFSTLVVATLLVALVPLAFLAFSVNDAAQYTVELAGFEGLNNATTLSHTVSPAFNITVRVRNPNTFGAWCHNHGEAVVSYSGVGVASGRVPGFCAQRKSEANFTVVARGVGVRLSDGLRGRLASEWRNGTAKVSLEMELHYYPSYVLLPTQYRPGTLSISQELMLGLRPQSSYFSQQKYIWHHYSN
ncbi:unnamed protein product [Urochloa decumbens]|uniref:Late embryogenesis abundant protein LEA-2 subgroup domain-containing protein n=1 Tax=Urochloa decumbens TaxID=240449 RepID=A0ABC8YTX5_9POAL